MSLLTSHSWLVENGILLWNTRNAFYNNLCSTLYPISFVEMKIDTSLTMPQLPESLSQAGLQFTVATEEDFDEIMAMSQDIYGGLDYLPTRYTSWLQETNRTVILARKQGKVVSPFSLSLLILLWVSSLNFKWLYW